MAASVETQSPNHTNQEGTSLNMVSATCFGSSPSIVSPSSDKRLWSNLRNRIDVLLEEKSRDHKPIANSITTGESERSKRFKNDSMLLLKGFDSVSHTLSLLSSNLDNALQGVRELAKPPTLSEILHSNLQADQIQRQQKEEEEEEEEESKGTKRKHESDVEEKDDSSNEEEKRPKDRKIMKRAKNIAISMAAKANSLARELKSIKSDLSFIQERCGLLEEENKRLRDGFVKGVRPEEDDLVRLQLEVLLTEKARLASENANLVRENQCLNQMVEYHQITSQDLSPSYEQVVQGLCLDFSSPVPQFDDDEEEEDESRSHHVSKALNESFEKTEEEEEEQH
ncbi:PREDICTED: FK506-binding protein 5-like [Camelina sativa]|uniref:FK506-binding protein 5-like n=1 Tax=Camelina sativa TaxID=90675 RepID=A0ABM0TS10_CAMSA|nr:PREDICTED: FK506-binding protein 5-like [Camelina sativa]